RSNLALPPLQHPPHPLLYTLSLHDALPISFSSSFILNPATILSNADNASAALIPSALSLVEVESIAKRVLQYRERWGGTQVSEQDRKSTRLNSSHLGISYAVFCLKKKRDGSCSRLGHPPRGSQRSAHDAATETRFHHASTHRWARP